MKLRPGDEISYEVFYLEMRTSPKFEWPKKPSGDIFISNSVKPSSRYFFDLYKAVGGDYEWTDKFELPTSEIDFFLCHPLVRMFTFFKDGWTAGFFMLDYRVTGICDLAYFGLVPEAIGFGYGKYMLKVAVKEGWNRNGTKLLTVNTNSLDHPNALPLYKKIGFMLKNKKKATRVLTKSRYKDSYKTDNHGWNHISSFRHKSNYLHEK